MPLADPADRQHGEGDAGLGLVHLVVPLRRGLGIHAFQLEVREVKPLLAADAIGVGVDVPVGHRGLGSAVGHGLVSSR